MDMKRRIIVAGNWKMNKNLEEVQSFFEDLEVGEGLSEVVIAPPFPFLHACVHRVQTMDRAITIAAQNCHQEVKGAYTGEVSAEMIASCHAGVVIVGHSERRALFGESDTLLNEKIKTALNAGLRVIYCCGEKKDEREAESHFEIVGAQIINGLKDLTTDNFENIVIAYEPVWAIGTGLTASSDQAEEMHKFIRQLLPEEVRAHTAILYGGSVKPGNFDELLEQPNIDGGLIGGASLDAQSFSELIAKGDRNMEE